MVDRRGWDVDIYGVSALLHLYPSRILDELREKLHRLRPDYEKLVVVYGECGMNERLDALLEEVGATRLAGPHCYEMYAGADRFAEIAAERPGTFFLTDWLVRNFDRAVVKGLGLDRDPELIPMVFGNYESVLYLRQSRHPRLATKAAEIRRRPSPRPSPLRGEGDCEWLNIRSCTGSTFLLRSRPGMATSRSSACCPTISRRQSTRTR